MSAAGLVPRDGAREHDPMLGGRSSSDSDLEGRQSDTLLASSAEFDEKAGFRRPAGRRRSFRWILGLTCLSMLLLFGLIFLQFFEVQSKAAPPEEAHHDDQPQQQEEPAPPPPPPVSVPEVTPTIAPTSTLAVPTQTPEVKLTPQQQFDLQTGFQVSNVTTLREYVFNVTRDLHSPDGYEKSMILVNGQSPGPLIEANTGDTIRVTVNNQMLEESTTIHWHGIDQRNSPWMDGVNGVTQCAIPPGQGFTYEFNLTDQRGTFWWHAHVTVQVTDGLFGPLVIHDPTEEIPAVDDDKLIMLLTQYLSAHPSWAPKKPGREPPPDNVILNGKNTFNCSSLKEDTSGGDKPADNHNMEGHNMKDMQGQGHNMAEHNSPRDAAPAECTWGSLYNTRVKSGSKTRLRLINHGTSTPIFVTVDGHTLEIVEIDGVEVAPIATTRVYMNPGQRYSVILTANQTAGNYLIRADAATRCFHMSHKNHKGMGMHGAPFGATAILSYDETDVGVAPIGKAWNIKSTSNPGIGKEPWGDHCEDLPFNLPKPVRSRTAYDVGERNFHYFTFRQERVGDAVRTHVNKTLFTPLKDDATLWKVLEQDISPANLNSPEPKLDFGKDQLVLVSKDDKAAQIVVNSDAMMLTFFRSGQNFQVIGWGDGLFGKSKTTWNFDNPMRRDTVTIPGFSHIVIRIVADNPGVWAFHCHYLWHAEAGMFVSIAQRMGELATMLGTLDATSSADSIKRKFCPVPKAPAPPALPAEPVKPAPGG
ncbi:diphenol oxidase [Colletotrichum plurivorum]|uniref:Diphenol oxidase n=1 Tax=Colletotrichum plurivorum TaxID=2175906 RepID=A0A8H6JTE6_9PEZI|nr:diphenol oxidase [Colletotrichum plurivorum]